MKKLIAVTQMQRHDAVRDEYQDMLDSRWTSFIHEAGYVPLILPNHSESAFDLMTQTSPVGILLTGGNDLEEYGGTAPNRDELEQRLIAYAIQKEIPLLGVCRGMQMINHFFGGSLKRVNEHVKPVMSIQVDGVSVSLNSYHQWAIERLGKSLKVFAHSEDRVVKAIRHENHLIEGIMWHPERISPFTEFDLTYFRTYFK